MYQLNFKEITWQNGFYFIHVLGKNEKSVKN